MKGERMSTYRLLVGKPKRNRPLGRPRHKEGGDNIEMYVGEIGLGGELLTGLVWLRIMTSGELL
jgi:hypothetical protein